MEKKFVRQWLVALWTTIVASSVSSADDVTQGHQDHSQNKIEEIPTWDELDQRPLPPWYDQAKFGIFFHWGVFSVPAFCSEWFGSYWRNRWGPCQPDLADFVERTERSNFAYEDYAHRFTADLYNATQWAELIGKSGAQYIVFVSKHHDGYCNWDSRSVPTTWHWNSIDVGPRRDLLGELAKAVKNTTSPQTGNQVKFGVYHSLYEWYNPLYQRDRDNNFQTQDFVDTKTLAEMYDLVNKYEPEIMWSDGEWETNSDYWKAREFLQWYATKSSVAETAVWNDRWGNDTLCKHGGFLTCTDRYDPDKVQQKKWEDAMTIDTSSWGYNRRSSIADYQTAEQLIHQLIKVVAYNGNLLLNVGPSSDGTISPIFADRLLAIGEWMMVNGEAIYGTRPWQACQSESAMNVYYTATDDFLYVHVTKWPKDNVLHLECPIVPPGTSMTMLGVSGEELEWSSRATGSVGGSLSGTDIVLPMLTPALVPCQYAWVVKLQGVLNL